jgi:hypothetical protein
VQESAKPICQLRLNSLAEKAKAFAAVTDMRLALQLKVSADVINTIVSLFINNKIIQRMRGNEFS